MNKHQKQFAIVILLAMAAFYFVGEGLEKHLGSTAFIISSFLALGILVGAQFFVKRK